MKHLRIDFTGYFNNVTMSGSNDAYAKISTYLAADLETVRVI